MVFHTSDIKVFAWHMCVCVARQKLQPKLYIRLPVYRKLHMQFTELECIAGNELDERCIDGEYFACRKAHKTEYKQVE